MSRTMEHQPGIKAQIDLFLTKLKALYVAEYTRLYGNNLRSPVFHAEYGSKNARIVVADSQHSVYCFIDLSNGDIYKAAGWKAPAKGKRGSIWNDECDVGIDKPCNLYGGGLYKR